MSEITPNIVADLLPAYLAGDASEDTRRAVEERLEQDPELRALLEELAAPPPAVDAGVLPAGAEWRSVEHTRKLLRRRQRLLAIAAALSLGVGAAVLPDGGPLSPGAGRLLPAALAYLFTLGSWATFLATCRELAPTGLEPSIGGRGWAVRLTWAFTGYFLGLIGGVLLQSLMTWESIEVSAAVAASVLAVALGEKWRQVSRPEDMNPPVSLFGG